jgi:hypothetical protein
MGLSPYGRRGQFAVNGYPAECKAPGTSAAPITQS